MTALAVLLLVASVIYRLVAAGAAGRLRRRRLFLADAPQPSVSVLKAIRGAGAHSEALFATALAQEYADYEVLFGVADEGDPAIPIIERVMAAHPHRPARLCVVPDTLSASWNPKVRTLAALAREARHDVLVIHDSDVAWRPDTLGRLVSALQVPGVGLVSCLYRSGDARLTVEGLVLHFAWIPSVCVATVRTDVGFSLGATVALQRPALEAVGGFEALGAFIAEDYHLGRRIAAAGYRVRVAPLVVDLVRGAERVWTQILRQVRWAVITRRCAPVGYAGSVITHTAFWAVVAALLAGGTVSAWVGAAVATGIASLAARSAAIVALGREAGRGWWLTPLVDLAGVVAWVASFVVRQVTWRGQRFRIGRGGIVLPSRQ